MTANQDITTWDGFLEVMTRNIKRRTAKGSNSPRDNALSLSDDEAIAIFERQFGDNADWLTSPLNATDQPPQHSENLASFIENVKRLSEGVYEAFVRFSALPTGDTTAEPILDSEEKDGLYVQRELPLKEFFGSHDSTRYAAWADSTLRVSASRETSDSTAWVPGAHVEPGNVRNSEYRLDLRLELLQPDGHSAYARLSSDDPKALFDEDIETGDWSDIDINIRLSLIPNAQKG